MKENKFSSIKGCSNLENLKTEYEYYAVCIEDSYYVKKGAIEKTALKAKEEGEYIFLVCR